MAEHFSEQALDAGVAAWFGVTKVESERNFIRDRMQAAVQAVLAHHGTSMLEARPQLPDLNDDLVEILGRPNFACIQIAKVLRASGVEIKSKAEHEQATVLHYMLAFYLQHGADWWTKASEDLAVRMAAVRAPVGAGHG